MPSLLLCRLQISKYGVVSFGAPLRPCCSQWNPEVAPQPVPFVAPLWSSGSPASVFYRTALGEGEAENVRRRLVQAYNVQHFEPKIVIIVTWVDLACCAVGTLGKQVSVAYAHTYRIMHTHACTYIHTGAHTPRTSMVDHMLLHLHAQIHVYVHTDIISPCNCLGRTISLMNLACTHTCRCCLTVLEVLHGSLAKSLLN